MVVEYFKSIVCPRCIPVTRELKKLEKEFPELEIKHIEVLSNMSYSKDNKVRTLPTVKIGDAVIGGFLSGHKVRKFILSHLQKSEN